MRKTATVGRAFSSGLLDAVRLLLVLEGRGGVKTLHSNSALPYWRHVTDLAQRLWTGIYLTDRTSFYVVGQFSSSPTPSLIKGKAQLLSKLEQMEIFSWSDCAKWLHENLARPLLYVFLNPSYIIHLISLNDGWLIPLPWIADQYWATRWSELGSVWILLFVVSGFLASCRLVQQQLKAFQFTFLNHSRVSFYLMVFRSGLFSFSPTKQSYLFLLSHRILHTLTRTW